MKLNRTILSSSVGNALEWYEYMLYAHFSHIIAKTFFPSENSALSLTITFAVFAVGFVSRPLGALIFGYIGDRYSRKLALTTSIALIAIPTTALGLMPSFEQIGIIAPIAIIIIRILQGASLGGEYSSSLVFLVESAPDGKKGYFGSFSTASIALGMVFSSIVIFILNFCFSAEQMEQFAWRIPFLLSFIIGFVGIYIRKKLKENDEFAKEKHEERPIRQVLSKHLRIFILCCGIFATATTTFFFLSVFLKIVMKEIGFSESVISMNYLITMLVFMFASVFFGYVSDKISPEKILLTTAAIIVATILPFLYVLSLQNVTLTFVFSSLMAFLLSAYLGVMPTMFVMNFPVKVRSTGVALSYNVPVIFFGGTTPIIMNFLMNYFSSIYGIFYYILFACSLSIFCLLFLIRAKKT